MNQSAVQFGLGLVFWPVLFLWTSALGWHWTTTTVRVATIVVAGAGLLALFIVPRDRWYTRYTQFRRQALWLAVFGLIVAFSIVTRWQHIRTLVLPNWVDSVHHMMLVRLMLEQGTVPQAYEPFIETARPMYHWGYHLLLAWPLWFFDVTDPFYIAGFMLQFGQMLNVLVALMLYAAGRQLFSSRRAGLFAATLGMLVSWFPAYYVSWGRYTHLTGLLVLGPFCIMLWRLHHRPSWGAWTATVLLGAGLLLIHVRIAFLAVTFVIVLAVMMVVERGWKTLVRWSSAGLATLLVTSPWIRTLANSRQFQGMVAGPNEGWLGWWESYNTIPWHLVRIPNNRELFALATGGLSELAGWEEPRLWLQVAAVAWFIVLAGALLWQWRRSRLRTQGAVVWPALGVLFAWSGLTAILLNLDAVGLRPITFVHNATAVITLFVPLSLAAAGLLAWIGSLFVPRRWAGIVTAVLVLGIGLWGARNMRDVVNPTTVLAQPADVRALRWIRENTAPDATFAVNVWPWLRQTYAGSDGGYWIEVLTDRDTIVPPALYTTTASQERIETINTLLDRWHETESLDDPEVRARLQDAGVTHVYVGPRGGHLKPEQLRASPFVRLVYENDDTYIFELLEDS